MKKYGVIIADPPWPYNNPKSHRPRLGGYTYETMTAPNIWKLPVADLAADNCSLFLWGTWPKVPLVTQTMEAWGFDHVTGLPWIKVNKDGVTPSYRTGHWVAGCSEYVLIGRRGYVSPPPPPRFLGLLSDTLLAGPHIREHSRKPDSVHDIAEMLEGPYLEMFAKRPRDGWDIWGHEAPDGIEMPWEVEDEIA